MLVLAPLWLAWSAALPPVSQEEIPTQAAIDEAIDRGVERLLSLLEPEEDAERVGLPGQRAGRSSAASHRVGTRALLAYTLLKCGVPRDSTAVSNLILDLSFEDVQNTYTAGCLLLALGAYDPHGQRAWMEELTARLLDWQGSGGWAYPDGGVDLSNTQYAALGLWAAAGAGIEIESTVWSQLAENVLRYSHPGGGFSYHPSANPATGSMTSAGVGTLALCEAQLLRARSLSEPLAARIRAARGEGLQWLEGKFSVRSNPVSGAWLYYYLYGLERMGAFCGVDWIGEHDWYIEGARELLKRQSPEGSWADLFDPAQSCFALLFLRRATAGGSWAPESGVRGANSDDTPHRGVRVRVTGEGPIEVEISGFASATRRSLEWSTEAGRGLHIERVEYLLDDTPIAVLLGDALRPAGRRSYWARLCGLSKGEHAVKARVHVVTQAGAPVLLESESMPVEVRNAPPGWMERARDSSSVLELGDARVTATSTWKGDESLPKLRFDPANALDGHPRRPWLAALGHATPTLQITLKPRRAADRLELCAAHLTGLGPNALSRPIRVKVSIDRKRTHELFIPPGPGQFGVLHFGETLNVGRIRLEILDSTTGSIFPAVGLGEVELRIGNP